MKRIATVILICAFIIGCFVVPSFADEISLVAVPYSSSWNSSDLISGGLLYVTQLSGSNYIDNFIGSRLSDHPLFLFHVGSSIYYVSDFSGSYLFSELQSSTNTVFNGSLSLGSHDSTYDLYYYSQSWSNASTFYIPEFSNRKEGLSAIRGYIDNPPSQITKNPNVDAFLANTLISMGIKFESASDALSVGAAAWKYCTDENNLTDGDRLNKHDWDIEAFANIVNAHSNFYLNWYKGYKVNENVCLALTWYLYDNFESSAGLSQPRAGTLSGVSVTRDAQYGYKGITNAATNYNMQSSYTFYSGSTLTYVNGSFVSETNLVNGSQFLYEPSEVRRFIAFPPASVDDTSPDPNATGTLTNGDTTYDIDIQFPSLDWLKDLIIALIDAVTNLFTTIADFLSQILDAILGLFSDVFAGLEEFGDGIVDWISVLFAGFSGLITGYLPSDISAIVIAFIGLNIGIGLIKFILGKV